MRPDFIEKSLVNQMFFYQWIAHTESICWDLSPSHGICLVSE